MSFFNTKPWAKIPTDLLENKAMRAAESRLPPQLAPCCALLYVAGAIRADADGIFDIGDGEEFSRLIKAESPETVRQVAAELIRSRIIAHVPDSTVYLFAEWEYSTRGAPLPLVQRFAKAGEYWKKKKSEDAFFSVLPSTKVDTMRNGLNNTPDKCCDTIQAAHDECLNTIQGGAAANAQNRTEQSRQTRPQQRNIITRFFQMQSRPHPHTE